MTGRLAYRTDLKPEPAEVRRARHAVREQVSRWGLAALTDTAAVVVSELVTNLVRHAHAPGWLRVAYVNGVLRIEVFDPDPHTPQPCDADLDDEAGRGLALVATLAAEFGWEPRDGGKVVYAELHHSDVPA
ncbi:ATP-binding protein [Carbonactinospora thermoautotrophica]|uniref:Putative regulatory protein n=1 Tax=Carbonactinospora thermoautotrophica TaxID=1469144 RepID=A0A132MWX9_9ACTN|nr:ATP-binding protein [Carbonactinospora thermoautotrophica]KWX02408.1 putative regulatory protein [Carbonactinospora thermoautotrophica]